MIRGGGRFYQDKTSQPPTGTSTNSLARLVLTCQASVVKADFDKLCEAGATIQRYTHEYVAHRSAMPTPWLLVTYADLNAAFDAIARIADCYGRLLMVGGVTEPMTPEALEAVFQVLWDSEAAQRQEGAAPARK